MNEYLFTAGLYYSHKVTVHPQYNETSLHTHDEYEILHFKTGAAELVLENKKILLFPDALLLIPPFTRHRINILSDLPYERAVINFSALPHASISKNMFSAPQVLNISQVPRVLTVLDRMRDYNELFGEEEKKLIFNGLVTELLLLLQKIQLTSQTGAGEHGLFMTQALAYIDKHITEIATIEELCDALHISRAYLYREFQAALGVSPMRYINRRRLLIAQNLLCIGEDATKVCFRCGYREYSAFYRAYRAYFGCSPQETRLKG